MGTRREFGGVMSKPWRMVALHVGAWATLALLATGRLASEQTSPAMNVALGVIILGCGTSTIRFSPPLILTKEHVDVALEIFDEAITESSS